jgi:hypothetical protein
MTCEKIRDELVAYCDGELSERDRIRVAAHLKTCPTCAQEEVRLGRVDQMLTSLERITPSPDFAATFWRRLEQEGHIEPESRWSRWWREWQESITNWQMLPALAGAASILVFFAYLQSHRPDRVQTSAPAPTARALSSTAKNETMLASSRSDAEVPTQLTEKPGFFVNYGVIADLEKFSRFDEIAATAVPAKHDIELADSDIPKEVLEKPHLFTQYPILRQIERLQNLDAVLTLPTQDKKEHNG